jgi:hypothetical protein
MCDDFMKKLKTLKWQRSENNVGDIKPQSGIEDLNL